MSHMHYPVGHDDVVSAFEVTVKEGSPTRGMAFVGGAEGMVQLGNDPVVDRKPLMEILSDPKCDTRFSFFFGGVGDGRNAFCSLGSLWRQLDELITADKLTMKQVARIKVSMFVNDIDPTILCRMWVNTSLLYDYGAAMANGDAKAIEQARSVVFDVYLNSLLRDEADAAVRAIVSRGLPPVDSHSRWGGTIVNQETVDQMSSVYDRWVKGEVTPDQMYTFTNPPCPELIKNVAKSLKVRTNGSIADVALAVVTKALSLPREEMAKIGVSLGCWEIARPITSAEDVFRIRARLSALVASYQNEYERRSAEYLNLDKKTLDEVMIRYSKFHILYDLPSLHKIRDQSMADQIFFFKENVLPSLHPNLTFCHSNLSDHWSGNLRRAEDVLVELCGGKAKLQAQCSKESMDSIQTMMSKVGSKLNTSRMNPNGLLEETVAEMHSKVSPKHKTLEEATDDFFGDAARAIYFLSNCGGLNLSFGAGDMHDVAIQLFHEQVDFDHIYLSNVPDYTGLVLSFARFVPLLKPEGYLQHSILFPINLFSNLEEYIFSTTRLPTVEWVRKMLGLRYVTGSLSEFTPILWQCDYPKSGAGPRVTEDEVTQWLHEVLLRILKPAEVHVTKRSAPIELSPNTVDVIPALTRLLSLSEFQLPQTWLSTTLGSMGLQTFSLESRAECPKSTPDSPTSSVLTQRSRRDPTKTDLSLYINDISTSLFTWASRFERHQAAVEVVIPQDICRLMVRKAANRGMGTTCRLGCAVFAHESIDVVRLIQMSRNGHADPVYSRADVEQMAEIVRSYGGRTDILSAFDWDIKTGIIRFEFSDVLLHKYQDNGWHAAILLHSVEWRQLNDLHEPLLISFPPQSKDVRTIRMHATPPNHCAVCNALNGVHRCGGCKIQRYCSKSCQKIDWTKRNHKYLCKAMMKDE